MPKASRLRSTRLIATLLLAGFVMASAAVQPAQAQRARRPKWANLSGTWRLNEILSTHWSNEMSNEVGSELIVTPVSFDTASFYVTHIKGAETNARVRELLDATRRLEIFQQRRKLTLNATGANFVVLARTFLTDDVPALKAFGPEGKGRSHAQWTENRFIIETTSERGPRLTETYEVSGGRLYLSVEIQKDRLSIPTFVLRIYDKVPA